MSNKATLVNIFAQGDVPQGTDFANLINSQVNLSETVLQSISGPLQATKLVAPTVSAGNINITGSIQNQLNVTCDVSAIGQNVYCSGSRYSAPAIVSAIGTTQAQAQVAQLITTITRLQGTSDGQATGYSLLANRTGWVQYTKYEGTVSANLWPPTGGSINNLGTNIPFPLAGGNSYTIFHVAASAYGVK